MINCWSWLSLVSAGQSCGCWLGQIVSSFGLPMKVGSHTKEGGDLNARKDDWDDGSC